MSLRPRNPRSRRKLKPSGEGVVMFRYVGRIVAARGPLWSFEVRYENDWIDPDAPHGLPLLASTRFDIDISLRGVQLVTVDDGEPDWDSPVEIARLPAPRLPG